MQESNEIHTDQLEIAEMSKFFKRNYISEFVSKIDSMEIVILDSHSLRQAMQLFGINMRYMSDVAIQTS